MDLWLQWADGLLILIDFALLAALSVIILPGDVRSLWRAPYVGLAIGLFVYIGGHTLYRFDRWFSAAVGPYFGTEWPTIRQVLLFLSLMITVMGAVCCLRVIGFPRIGKPGTLLVVSYIVASAVVSALMTWR